MALSDLAVYNEYTYSAMTEILPEQLALFNAATRGGLVLRTEAHQGDYSEEASFALISGLVRRRNAYADTAVTEKSLEHIEQVSVKVAAGTPPVRLDKAQFRWIQRNPEEAGIAMGRQLAVATLQDMLNSAILAFVAATSNVAGITNDQSATSGGATFPMLLNTAAKFGDRAEDIACWLMHSKSMFDIFGTALANTTALFNFGTVNVRQDGFGRPFVVSDIGALVNLTPTPDIYRILGLTQGAVEVDQNDDFDANMQDINGYENIRRTYQAEWSYNVKVKGFSWDKTNGGHSPTTAAIATGTNWDQYVSSVKDTAGVILLAQ